MRDIFNRNRFPLIAISAAVLVAIAGCSTQKKLTEVRAQEMRASINLAKKHDYIPQIPEAQRVKKDTLKIKDGEHEFLIMDAIKDDDGDMVAHQMLDEAIITARFRNVAERNGKIDLEFQVIVPEAMQDSKWQLRFTPDMYILEDTVRLESVVITGAEYRKAQLRGYQQYERFLSRIIQDTSKFVNIWQLELFLQRNIPELYAFKSDTSRVSDAQFASVYGVTEKEAVEHYTNKIARNLNRWRIGRKEKMYRKYVKVPISNEGLRLDKVVKDINGDFIYNYVQTIETRPKLRKVDIVLTGSIWESDQMLYKIPPSDPLTFYISSMSAFVDGTEKYLLKVIERRAEANTSCYIDFALGKYDVDEKLSNNESEITRIKGNLASLMENKEFDLDSIVVTASASPEGRESFNTKLAQKRSGGISTYFDRWMKHYTDSLDAEKGFRVDENGNVVKDEERTPIRFVNRSDGENWDMLDYLVETDTTLTEKQKKDYDKLSKVKNNDDREIRMQRNDSYRYLREKLYPRLRTVKFDFHLHRKGMIKDTVHTTVLDTTYMNGVQAIRDRDYETAITLLRPYNDYNAAIAYVCLDYNASAMAILKNLDKTPQVNYMLAVLYGRNGDDQNAVQHYMDACKGDPSYVFRGNLDPEIAVLIKRYGLNKEEEIEY